MSLDQLIDEHVDARITGNYKRADEIKQILDENLIFIFTAPQGKQEVWYLTEKFFQRKAEEMTNRKYVEKRMQEDLRYEKIFLAWVTSNK